MSITDSIHEENGDAEKRNFFDAPGGYFDSFADQLQKKIEQDELKEMAPLLSSLKKTELFSAPPGYFDILHLRIRERIQYAPRKIFGIFSRMQLGFSLGLAASVILVLIFFPPPFQEENIRLADVPWHEIDQFVHEEIESAEIPEDLPGFDEVVLNTSFVNAETEELEDYIINEIELTEIIDEL